MAIGPSKGNGFEWDRGPWHLGIWQEGDSQGFGDMTVLGHKDGVTWAIDTTVEAAGDAGGWQNIIDTNYGGHIGTFYVTLILPKINAQLDLYFPLNPYVGTPIQNTDKYSKDVFNALMAQFTKADADGHLHQGP